MVLINCMPLFFTFCIDLFRRMLYNYLRGECMKGKVNIGHNYYKDMLQGKITAREGLNKVLEIMYDYQKLVQENNVEYPSGEMWFLYR